jgi:hypothetical protein
MAVVINGNGNITGLDGVFSADSVNTLVDTRIDSDSFVEHNEFNTLLDARIDSDSFVELTGNQTIAGVKTFSDSANFTGGHLRVYNNTDSEEQILIAEVSGGYSNGAGVSLRRGGTEMGRINADYFDGMTFYVTDGSGGAATQKARLSTGGSFVIGENESPYNAFSVRDSDMGFEVNPNASKEVRLNAYDRANSVFKTMALQADPVVIRPGGANGVGYTTIDNDGIKFNGDTSAANGLDDYEEGTWTPSYESTSGSFSSVTHSNQSGFYTKVGNVVTAQCRLDTTAMSIGTASGYLLVAGLPYQSISAYQSGDISYSWGYSSVWPTAVAIQGSSTKAYLFSVKHSGNTSSIAPSNLGTGQTYLYFGIVYLTL